MAIQSHRDLQVWQLGVELAVACYEVTKDFPKSEAFGMTSQIRRASTAVPANIAEGYGRNSRGDYLRFLQIARGSLMEVQTHLTICVRVGLADEEQAKSLFAQIDTLAAKLHRLTEKLAATAS
jgi:four helix bundle protein